MKGLHHIVAFCLIASGGASCAATPSAGNLRKDAVLINVDRSDIREAIRIFVREDAGPFVRANPDSLRQSPDMIVRRRARDVERQSRTLPPANLNYHLVSDGAACWLIRHETDRGSPLAAELLLPKSAQCAIYTKTQ